MIEREPLASPPPIPPAGIGPGLRWLVALNVILGVSLWFGLCSDYEWSHEAASAVHVVLAVALATWLRLRCPKGSVQRALALPSLLAGWLAIAGAILPWIPPFTLGAMFSAAERAERRKVEELPTLNGSKRAIVHLQPTGAYASGTGRILVEVAYPMLPGVRRTVWGGKTYKDGEPGAFVEWLDNETIRVIEQKQELKPGWVEWRPPLLLRIPLWLLSR